jgi:hypothetical protein
MKTHYLPILAAVGFAVALARPCLADQTVVTPTPQSNAQMSPPLATAPPSYVWDGKEYVGQSGGKYYYLGPHQTWTSLDSSRQDRFQQWQQNNPDWQQREIRNTHYLGHDQGQSTPPMNATQPNATVAPAPAAPGQNTPPQ